MRNFVLIVVIISIILSFFCLNSVEAAKKTTGKTAKVSGMSQDQIEQISQTIDRLTRKVYSKSLFSPKENEELIELKIKLDNEILVSQDTLLSQLYYKTAMLYKMRDLKTESIDCFQTLLENFSDTPFGPKARKELEAMGIKIVLPQDNPDQNKTDSDEEDQEEE